jgi:hypothetical protein
MISTLEREFRPANYNPGPGYYSTGPSDPKYNDVYKSSFFQNRNNIDESLSAFGTSSPRFKGN